MSDCVLDIGSQQSENLLCTTQSNPNGAGQAPIDLSNDEHDVILLDISNNKKWMAYVTYKLDKLTDSLYDMHEGNKRMFITRRRFTAVDETTGREEFAYSGNLFNGTTGLHHVSSEITEYVLPAGRCHCKFLSISNDGKYVVLSYFERNLNAAGRHKLPSNPDCLIFEVIDDNTFKLVKKIHCIGRAVFLNKSRDNYSLAIITPNTVKVYAKFPKSTSVTFMFDLRPFRTTNFHFHETVETQEAYIKNAAWLDISDPKNDEMKRLVTFTRHIRHNILTTPFNGGVVRIWSIVEDGTRLTSFSAPKQHVMAFSKNYKYTAAYVENTRSVNIYNVKSGLLVYRLHSREKNDASNFIVSHIRFCYDGRYVAMCGWEGNSVAFEIWYVEAETSIYRRVEENVTKPAGYREGCKLKKAVQPFVRRGITNGRKTLKGYYTSYPDGKMTTMCVELDIDRTVENPILTWIPNTNPRYMNTYEIENGLQNTLNLQCGKIDIFGEEYLIRFGKHTVQLWKQDLNNPEPNLISRKDILIYIRAYKGPDYGYDYSFRETWKIDDFRSIRFIGGTPSGRMLVNITETVDGMSDQSEQRPTYHTEEIFLPLDELIPSETPRDELASNLVNSRALRFDYHKLESACQALHFLYNSEDCSTNIQNIDTYTKNLMMMRDKTKLIIELSVGTIDIESNYFSTIAGSGTLAMLASFPVGRDVIKSIVVRSIPISIFSYNRSQSEINRDNPQESEEDRRDREEYENEQATKKALSIRKEDMDLEAEERSLLETNKPTPVPGELNYRSSELRPILDYDTTLIATNENVLTVLIDELDYDLYKLLFNRILSDSKKLGPGCLSSLTDALLFLQEGGNSDLLLLSSQKLSYLEIKKEKLAILTSEINQVMKVKTLQKEYISSIRNLEAHATMEQIIKHEGKLSILLYHFRKGLRIWSEESTIYQGIKRPLGLFYKRNLRNPWRRMFVESRREAKKLSKVCVVPLPHFSSYSDFPEDRPKNKRLEDEKVIPYKPASAFVRVALDQHSNNIFRQGDTVLEVLLQYKWQNFARQKFLVICFVHVVYYISYCTGVLFAPELYGVIVSEKLNITHPGQIVSIALMLVSLLVLLYQEVRQFLKTHAKIDYLLSGYNWVDICAFVFPFITLVQLWCGLDNFSEVSSVATLILWTHAILRLRVISYFGITLETMIQLSKNIASVLFIMLLVILAFTQSYIVLLRLEPDEYFQDEFEGSFEGTAGEGIAAEGSVVFASTSADNGFTDWFKAFYQVWLFIYGVWDPIIEGDAGDSKMIMAMSIVFSLITVLIFFNMVIALMSSTVEEVKQRGKKVWVSHFAAVVSEIELLWCNKKTKHSRKNNPTYIYYIANYDSVKRHEEGLEKETQELLKKLHLSFFPYVIKDNSEH